MTKEEGALFVFVVVVVFVVIVKGVECVDCKGNQKSKEQSV